MSLVAQFIQGIDITETAISEGLYAIAANLLKQELETLAAIDELEQDARCDGAVPKFRGRLQKFGRLYGNYNEVAHPTRAEVVEQLSTFSDGERYGPTTIPQFQPELFRMLYANQITFMLILLTQMKTVFVKAMEVDWSEEEQHMSVSAMKILINEGAVTVVDGE